MAFRDLSGHRHVSGLLGRALRGDSLPHSLIFAGPEGVGKRRFALALAQAVNCLQPVEDHEGLRDACGTCGSCRKIDRRTHPDVMLVEPEDRAIAVDAIREVVGQVAYRPYEGRCRVVIVDQADLMQAQAQNALLKTLEEPPARNVFILVAERPDALLDTIRSRCCVLRFSTVAADEIARELMTRHGYAEAEARAAAALAGGSFTRALATAGGDLAEARAVAAGILVEASRADDQRMRLALGAALLAATAKKGKGKAREGRGDSPDRGALGMRLRAMLVLLRDLAVLAEAPHGAGLANADLRSELAQVAGEWDRARVARAFSAVSRALAAVEQNANGKIVADWLAFQL